MDIFDKLFGLKGSSGPYRTEAQFETNLARQISMTRQVLAQHKEYQDRELRLEFLFGGTAITGLGVRVGWEESQRKHRSYISKCIEVCRSAGNSRREIRARSSGVAFGS